MDFEKLKVADLKRLLKERNLGLSGIKSELVARLQSHEASSTEVDPEAEAEIPEIGPEDVVENEDELLEEGDEEAAGDNDVEDVEEEEKIVEKVSPEPVNVPTKITFASDKIEKEEKKLTQEEEAEGKESIMVKRAERFGVQSADAKKLARAQRFGIPITAPAKTTSTIKAGSVDVSAEEMEKRRKRAERFGSVVSSSLIKTDEDERILKRKQRFGSTVTTNTSSITPSTEPDEKKRKRLERFGPAK